MKHERDYDTIPPDRPAGRPRVGHMYDVAAGIKVVEVAMYMFVPTAGAVLADWGAGATPRSQDAGSDPVTGVRAA